MRETKRETSFLFYRIDSFKYTSRRKAKRHKLFCHINFVISNNSSFFFCAFLQFRVHPKSFFAWFVFSPSFRDRAYLPFLSREISKYRRRAFRLLPGVSHSSFHKIGAASFAKTRISERNDRRDERRPQIYVSPESRDSEYFECTVFSGRWSSSIATAPRNNPRWYSLRNYLCCLSIFLLWYSNSVSCDIFGIVKDIRIIKDMWTLQNENSNSFVFDFWSYF